MKKYLPLLLLSAFFFQYSQAQFSRYIIKLKDKGPSPFSISNPLQYLSQRAIDRRTRYNIAIDSTDLPVSVNYIDSIRLSGAVTILSTSKWLNQVAIKTTDASALAKINSFPFVITSMPVASIINTAPAKKKLEFSLKEIMQPVDGKSSLLSGESYAYGYSNGQVKVHQGDFLHNHGFRGEGMQMAILDAGFYHYLSLPTFDSIRANNQVLGTFNFVTNNTSVNEDHPHGMECLSTIAANMPGVFVGTAPKTSFYLFVTEDVASEYPIEEQNWAAGLERADSLGVSISSTSLGYTEFDNAALNYTYNNMNGHTTISARAANFASKKGMLVVVAAGNEGTNPWHYITTPGDADSVMAVGAVDTLGNVGSFSSYGPSSDGDIKPDVAAVGVNAVVANPSTGLPSYGSGTSFACPNMAGLTTCLWQAFPEINGRGIINAMEVSATKINNPDNRVGYGVPNMKAAFVILFKKLYSQQAAINNCSASLQFTAKTDNTINLVLERKLPSETDFSVQKTFAGNGSFALHNFTYTDDLSSANTGIVRYRTKVVIGTDTAFYADSLSVNYLQQCTVSENKITIAPNPVTDHLNISIQRTTTAKADIIIQNAGGQRVYTAGLQLTTGTNNKTVSMQQMSKGIYFVTVLIDNKKALTTKILKQ
ncbi:MAG: S8/S53 family peptidase [Ferruginibacter sp.]